MFISVIGLKSAGHVVLAVFGMHTTTPHFCCSVSFLSTNIFVKSSSMSPFNVPPSCFGEFVVYSVSTRPLVPSPLFTARCSSSNVNGISRVSFESSDKCRCPASGMLLTHSSFAWMGPYFCFVHTLSASNIPFIESVFRYSGYIPLVIICCSCRVPFRIRWNRDIRSSWNVSGVCIPIVPHSNLALYNLNSFAFHWFTLAACPAWWARYNTKLYIHAW